MRIEKINENQIRCTLTKSDLEEHQVLLNELAFGTDHAKDLFRDMMAQASAEFGFEAEDIPLMIEAVPVSPDKIVLIITKVEDPDELEDHFSKYMQPADASDHSEEDDSEDDEDEEQIVDLTNAAKNPNSPVHQLIEDVRRMAAQKAKEKESNDSKKKTGKQPLPETHRIYRFPSLAQTIEACSKIYPLYAGDNTLYKDNEESFYYLVMERGDHPQENFKRIGNVLSEYGLQIPYSYNIRAYFDEHFVKIIEHNAVNTLTSL